MILPWNQDAWKQLADQQGRNTHAWLLAGPPGLGKLDLGVDYARHLLGGQGRFDAATAPDFHVLMPERLLDPNGELVSRYGMRYFLTPSGKKPKSVISVEQVRALIQALSTYGHGEHKVVLISPADEMNINAANALLKVLEEPPRDTVFVLVTDRPDLLPATVRSRCSVIGFRPPPHPQGLAWLSGKVDDQGDLGLVLSIAGDAPLLALRMHRARFPEARRRIVGDIERAATGQVDVISLCEGWREVGTEQALSLLRGVLADLIRIRFHPEPPSLFNPDRKQWLQETAKRINLNKAFALIDRIGAHLQDTNTPLDQSLAAADFLLEFSDIVQ